MLIVLEGLDGAGKSTQVSMLRDYLKSLDPSTLYIHFPRYDSAVYGGLIGSFLQGRFGPLEGVHPKLVALLFAEDRHGAAGEIRHALENGSHVLLDRYVYSNIAYQCAKLSSEEEAEELRKWIIDTEFGQFKLPVPDLNLFLDVPIGFVEENLRHDREGNDRNYLEGAQDIHEANIGFQKKVRSMYCRQATLDPRFKRIECSDEQGNILSPDAIFSRIKASVDSYEGL